MASSKDAFDRFWMWKKSRTLLKVTVWTKGEPTRVFESAAVVFPEEDLLQASFVDHETRERFTIRFEDSKFRLGEGILFADRLGEEFFECVDTGKSWIPVYEIGGAC